MASELYVLPIFYKFGSVHGVDRDLRLRAVWTAERNICHSIARGRYHAQEAFNNVLRKRIDKLVLRPPIKSVANAVLEFLATVDLLLLAKVGIQRRKCLRENVAVRIQRQQTGREGSRVPPLRSASRTRCTRRPTNQDAASPLS